MPNSTLTVLLVLMFAIIIYWYINKPVKIDWTQIKGKVVLVTGASSGIGEAVAYLYAEHGARLVLAARREDKLKQVKKKCQELGSPESMYVISDFTRYEDCMKLHKETLAIFGTVDVIILNHANVVYGVWGRNNLTQECLDNQSKVNHLSHITLATAFTPQLIKSGGQIAVVSSTAGLAPLPYAALYSTSKHALHGFFETYRLELRMQKILNVSITICIVGPTFTESLFPVPPPNTTHIYGVPISSPTEIAHGILVSIAHRQKSAFIPYFMKYVFWMSNILPDFLIDQLLLES